MSEAKIWDRYAKGYAKSKISDEQSYQKKLEITRGYFEPHMQVLEFGSGTGSTALLHAPYVKHIDAIDISPKMTRIAQEKMDVSEIDNISFSVSTIEDYKTQTQYDVIMGMSILHLLPNRVEAIAKTYDMLNDGGVFISSTICMGGTMKLLKYIWPIGRFLQLVPYFEMFRVDQLEQSIIDAGFTIDYKWQPKPDAAMFIVARK